MTAMLENIQSQPESLRAVAQHQFGAGAATLQSAAAAIRAAGRVVFTGMGSSLFASMPAAAHLNAHGFPALTVEASELLHYGGAAPHADAAMVLVSRSGDTIEVTRLLDRLGPRAHGTIGVSNVASSRLAREAPLSIEVHSGTDRMVAVQTYSGSCAVLLLLAEAVLQAPPESSRLGLDQVIEALPRAIDTALAQRGEWNAFLTEAEVVYLLGRGASLASVHEGALLMNETARLPSVAMSAALFRHGPVEVIGKRFRGIVFASQPATRELDLTLARELTDLGGRIRVSPAEGVPPLFAPLLEIVPVQVAACSVALDRGIDPGAFRFTSAVTATEEGFLKP